MSSFLSLISHLLLIITSYIFFSSQIISKTFTMRQAIRTRPRNLPTNLTDTFKSKTIKVFVNGENKCHMCEVNPRILKNWQQILVHISYNIKPRFGSVRKLLALSTLEQITSFQQLNPKEKYVALGESTRFKRISNGYKSPSEENIAKYKTTKEPAPGYLQKQEKGESSTTRSSKSPHMSAIAIKPSEDKKTKQPSNIKPKGSDNIRSSSVEPFNRPACLKQASKLPTSTAVAKNSKGLHQQASHNKNDTSQSTQGLQEVGEKVDQIYQRQLVNACSRSTRSFSNEKIHAIITPTEKRSIDNNTGSIEMSSSVEKSSLYVEPNVKRAYKRSSKEATEDVKPAKRERVCKGTKLERELERLMDLEKKKYMISMNALNHVKKVLSEIRHQTFVKQDNIFPKMSNNKKIIRPPVAASIPDIPDRTCSYKFYQEIAPDVNPTVEKPKEKLVIPHEAISKRIQDLSATVLAYKKRISEVNEEICKECEKCENKNCSKNVTDGGKRSGKSAGGYEIPAKISPSVETL